MGQEILNRVSAQEAERMRVETGQHLASIHTGIAQLSQQAHAPPVVTHSTVEYHSSPVFNLQKHLVQLMQ